MVDASNQFAYRVHEVFKPGMPAVLCVVPRPELERACRAAMERPGVSVLVYGPSNSGKTTLVLQTLRALGWIHGYTDCRRKMTPDEIREAAVEAIGAAPGERAAVWVVEDFHKLRPETRYALADVMRNAAALSNPQNKVVALGTTDTFLDEPIDEPELTRIAIAPMVDERLAAVIDAGALLLNVRIPASIRDAIVAYAKGQADVVHQFAMHLCLEAGVDRTQATTKTIGGNAYAAALRRTPKYLV